MNLLEKYKVAKPLCFYANNLSEAEIAANKIGNSSKEFVVKAQVLAGGRGKGVFKLGKEEFKGGIHIADSVSKVKFFAEKMLGQRLITKQTGAEGKLCNGVLISEKVEIEKEYYFAILLDRKSGGPVLVASSKGGMDIEAVAAQDPSSIVQLSIDTPDWSVSDSQLDAFLAKIGIKNELQSQGRKIVKQLFLLFKEKDATLIEINPLAKLKDGRLLCVDAKMNFDDNADFRQRELFKQRDLTQESQRDIDAAKLNLNYIGLDGNIGCLVNGAGLAMATMDLIKLHGGEPANFLDVGGAASSSQVFEGLRIVGSDKKVKAILVNVFGGIIRCDIIAEGIIQARKRGYLNGIPVVVRLQGNNVEAAQKQLASYRKEIAFVDDLDAAARIAVEKSQQKK